MRRISLWLALLSLAAGCASAIAADELILGLRVNGLNRGDAVVELATNDDIRFSAEESKRLGFSSRTLDALREPDGKVRITSSSAVKMRVDLDALTLQLDVPAQWFESINVSLGTRSAVKVAQLEGVHGWMNYALDVEGASGAKLDARLDTRLVSTYRRWSLVSEQGVQRITSEPTWRRKFTSLFYDDIERLAQFSIGDVNYESGLGASASNMRGVRWTRRYDFDPAVVPAPSFSWKYDLTRPSTVDVYVDQMRVRSLTAGPGPLNLADLSYFAGLRNVEVVVTERGGGQTRFAIPYYFSGDLLAAGKTTFDLALGELPSAESKSDWIAAASIRKGATDSFTWGLGGEARKRYQTARAELALRDERLGQLSLLTAVSRGAGDNRLGTAAVLTHSLSRNAFSWQGYLLVQSADFGRDQTPLPTQALLLRQAAASVNVSLSNRHSFAFNTGLSEYTNAPRKSSFGTRLSQNWGKGVSSWIAISHARERGQRSSGVSAGLSMSLGPRWSVSAAGEAGTDGTRQASIRGARSGSDDGWNNLRIASLARDSRIALESYVERPLGFAELAIAARAERFRSKDEFAGSARLSGATVFTNDGVWLSPSISQSFAVVDVPGTRNVRVYHNSQLAGRTGGDGKLVLPNLAGYTSNQVRIDDRDIPIEIELDRVLKEVTPRSNAGLRVEFVSRTVAAVGGTLVVSRDAARQPVVSAQLTVVRVDGEAEPVQSSTDGQGGFYLDGLAPGRWRIGAINRTTRCSVEIDISKSGVAFTDLGELVCVPPPQ